MSPMYVYRCPECGKEVTLHHGMTVEAKPVCQSHKGPEREMEKIIAPVSRPIIRGG